MKGQRPRRIIHLSGSAGAGKTTLGQQLVEHYGDDRLSVKDTDELANRISKHDPLHFVCKLREAVIAWLASVDDGKHDILLVGIMDITSNGKMHMVDMTGIATSKFFLDVGTEKLLQQFYCRFAQFATDPCFWTDVALDSHPIPSSNEVIAMDEHARNMHVTAGYKLVSHIEFIHEMEME